MIYVSAETAPFSEQDLNKLLEQSRRNNAAADITGFLLYYDGRFMQVLEGPEQAIRTLLVKVKADPRHRDFSILMESQTLSRTFGEWSMGFKRMGDSPPPPGFQDADQLAFNSNQFLLNPSRALQLLLASRNNPDS